MKTIIIVDASHLLHRFYHTNSDDLYRAANMFRYRLRGFLNQHPKAEMHICFDEGGSDYRNELYPSYKNNRPPMPERMRELKHLFINVSVELSPFVYIQKGIEADDIIASLTKRMRSGNRIIILTCDKDLNQLLAPNVSVINPFKLNETTHSNLRFIMGIDAAYVTDYLSLVGDTADGIVGIDTIGKARAVRLITQYGSIDDMLAMEDCNDPLIELIQSQSAKLHLNKKLTTLLMDLPVDSYLIQNI